MNPPVFAGRKSRFGCLGCLTRLVLILAAGCVLILLITAVFNPWAFFLGGKFNILASWTGWGTLPTKNGKYVVYVRVGPKIRRGRRGGTHVSLMTELSGTGYVCSPRGEIFPMHMTGSMRRDIGTNTDGEKITLGMYYWPVWTGSFISDHRPGIEIRGQWHNPSLAGDDHGSLSRAFNSDGTVYRGGGPQRPYPGDAVPVTLVPGSYAEFEAACRGK